MEKKYAELYKQHLENVAKIEELEDKIMQVRAKQNACRDDVLDIVAEFDALRVRSDDLHFTQTQVDTVRQLRGQLQQAANENERLKKSMSDMTAAGAYQDLEQIEMQKQQVEDLEARLERLKADEPAPSAMDAAGSVLEGEMEEARAERISAVEQQLALKQATFKSRCNKLKGNLLRLTELQAGCPEARELIDEILKAADSLKV